MYALTVDGREPSSVFRALDARNASHVRTNLDVGDFEVSSPERVGIIIERKEWGDFNGSLTSGRLGEQTARILEKCRETGARPVLLVEHDVVLGWHGSTRNTPNKFMECTLAKYALEGFSVVRTKNLEHTVDTVLWMLERCRSGSVPTFTPGFAFTNDAGAKRFRKKDFGKPWEVMLTAIRGVSKSTAKKLSVKFPNAKALGAALEAGTSLGVDRVGPAIKKAMREALLG
jgi:ERCC4-type nuclease